MLGRAVKRNSSAIEIPTDLFESFLRKKGEDDLKYKKDQYGGYLTIFDKEDKEILTIEKIGEIPEEKEERYKNLSREKGERLFLHQGHLCSFQSRNPEEDRYGGAIRTENLIISFSGFPEDADTLFVIEVAKLVVELEKDRTTEILTLARIENLHAEFQNFCYKTAS